MAIDYTNLINNFSFDRYAPSAAGLAELQDGFSRVFVNNEYEQALQNPELELWFKKLFIKAGLVEIARDFNVDLDNEAIVNVLFGFDGALNIRVLVELLIALFPAAQTLTVQQQAGVINVTLASSSFGNLVDENENILETEGGSPLSWEVTAVSYDPQVFFNLVGRLVAAGVKINFL